MGFFSDVVSSVSKAFGGNSGSSSGSSWANGLVDIGTSLVDTGVGIYANRQTQKANDEAAQRIVESNRQNAEAVEAANLEAQRRSEIANREAQERFERLSADSQPGVTYLKKLAATDPYQTTPGQDQYLSEARREAVNSLSRSGLRGSGRAVTAALKEIDSDLRNNFIEGNLSRSDQAADRLAGINTSANRASADYGVGAANYDYGVNAARYGTGNLASSAEVTGSSDIANQELGNSGLADINSAVASLVKEGRKSRYFSDKDTEEEVI